MFNVGRFNIAPFNLPGEQTTDVYIREVMTASMGAEAAAVANIHIIAEAGASIGSEAAIGPAVIFAAIMTAAVGASVIGYVDYFPGQVIMLATVDGDASAGENIYERKTLAASITAGVSIGCDTYFSTAMRAYVQSIAKGGSNFTTLPIFMAAIIDAEVASTSFDVRYILLPNITIPAGGVLVIDSESFNVWLDNVSAIDMHRSGWLDELTRNTFEIVVESGVSGPLESKLLYTEVFL